MKKYLGRWWILLQDGKMFALSSRKYRKLEYRARMGQKREILWVKNSFVLLSRRFYMTLGPKKGVRIVCKTGCFVNGRFFANPPRGCSKNRLPASEFDLKRSLEKRIFGLRCFFFNFPICFFFISDFFQNVFCTRKWCFCFKNAPCFPPALGIQGLQKDMFLMIPLFRFLGFFIFFGICWLVDFGTNGKMSFSIYGRGSQDPFFARLQVMFKSG